jgi:hypothetical protein
VIDACARLVERLSAEITRQRTRRGVFKSVAELEAAIEAYAYAVSSG